MQPEFVPSMSTKSILRQTPSTSLIISSKSFHSAFARCARIMVMSSRPNSIGMSKLLGSGTPTSNGALLNSMVKSSDLTVPISRSSINFSAAKATLIWMLNSTNGIAFTTLLDRNAHTTTRPLTKRSETSFSNNECVPQVRLGYTPTSLMQHTSFAVAPIPKHVFFEKTQFEHLLCNHLLQILCPAAHFPDLISVGGSHA